MSNLLEQDKLQVVWGFIYDSNSTTDSDFWEKVLKMQKQEYKPDYSEELIEKQIEEEERENERRIAEYNKYIEKANQFPFKVKSAQEEEIEKEQIEFFIGGVLDEALDEYETEFWSNFEKKFVHTDITTDDRRDGLTHEMDIPRPKPEADIIGTVDRLFLHLDGGSVTNIDINNRSFLYNSSAVLGAGDVKLIDEKSKDSLYRIAGSFTGSYARSESSFYGNAGRSLFNDAPGFESLKGKGTDIGGGARRLWCRPEVIVRVPEEKHSFMAEILKGIMERNKLEEIRKAEQEAEKKRQAKLKKHGVKFLFREARQNEKRHRLEKETSADIKPKKKRSGIRRFLQSLVACFSRKKT